MVSQRVEIPFLDNPGTSFVKESKTELRGAAASTIEWMILAYVGGKIKLKKIQITFPISISFQVSPNWLVSQIFLN